MRRAESLALWPKKPHRFGRQLPEADESSRSGEVIDGDQLQHVRRPCLRILGKTAHECKLIVAVMLHPDHDSLVFVSRCGETLVVSSQVRQERGEIRINEVSISVKASALGDPVGCTRHRSYWKRVPD